MANGEDREGPEAGAPAVVVEEVGGDRRRQHGADRARGRDDAEGQRAAVRRHHAGGDVGGDARGRAGERHADHHAGAEHDRPGRLVAVAVSTDAGDVDHAADQRHPARAVLVGQDAGEGLAHAPGDLLHRDGEREVGDGDAELLARPAPGTGRDSAGCPWPGSSSARRRPAWRRPGRAKPAETWKELLMAAEDRGGLAARANELSEGPHELSSRCNPKSVAAHRPSALVCPP